MKLTVTFKPQSVSVSAKATKVEVGVGEQIARDLVQIDPYEGEYSVTPTGEQQTLATNGKRMTDDMTIEATPDATHASPSSLTVNPTLEVDYETGTITASNSASATISPVHDDGYATSAFTHTVNVGGNTATQLFTLDETTYTPSGSAQIIPSGRLLTGNQTISAIAPPWYNMGDPMSWLGKEVTLFKSNFYLNEFTLYDTAFNGWTPSTTAKDILASVTAGTFVASDLANYEYYIVWESSVEPVYTGTPTLKAHTILTKAYQVQQIFRRPSSWANITAGNANGNATATLVTDNFLRYYGTTTGSVTYSWNVSYGFYYTLTAPTFSNATADSPTVTLKTPKLSSRCSTTYMSTGNAAKVDKLNSRCFISCNIYRVKKRGFLRGIYDDHTEFINAQHIYAPIPFKIGDNSYEADLGSTWEGWVDSAYNTAGASVSGNTIVIGASTVQYSSTDVLPSDAIVKSREYSLSG